ncbi:MFS transporter [Nocardioides sp. SYSU D00038]|uniref:MFS transporter n=1 Tax=Nocardioides sp. SYSU D00038 TaxID=2812554 RepID=UPI001968283A|nr:MFS transporter [Nocardioides sp. SYSU D00038]
MNLYDVSGRRRTLLWAALLSGLLMAMLDQTIVGTALPEIVAELGGPRWYVWTFTAYLVPATVLIPVAARISDRWGRRDVLLAGMVLFVAGSTTCALAPSMVQLVAGRAVQGAGAAALEALTFLLLTELNRGRSSAAAQGALAAVMAVSFVLGPLLGGLLTDHVGWRWAFWVNVPVGLAALVVVRAVLPAEVGRTEGRETPVDVLGITVLVLAIGVLLVGLGWHRDVGTWTDPRTGGLVVLGLGGLAGFLAVERRAAAPVIPPGLLTGPVTGRLLLAGSTASLGLYAGVLLLPRWYQEFEGLGATSAGVRMYPLLLGLLAAVVLGAALVVRTGAPRRVLLPASAATLGGAAGFATLGPGSPGWWPLVLMLVLGLGLGPALSGVQVVLGRTVSPVHLAAAMGTLLLARQVVGALALAGSEAAFLAGLDAGAPAARATGHAVALVAGLGAVLAAAALITLPRSARRLPAAPVAPEPLEPGRTRDLTSGPVV